MFHPQQLQIARKSRGLTLTLLAEALSVNPRTISRWERGETPPSEENTAALATILKYPVTYVLSTPSIEVPANGISFRAPSKMSARENDMASAAACNASRISSALEGQYRLPRPMLPTLEGYDPRMAAEAVRAHWDIHSPRVANAIHLVESRGVRVLSMPRSLESLDAFSFFAEGTPLILLEGRKTPERRRFDIAHELGHLVLHCGPEHPRGRAAETEANEFAANFLMPHDDIMASPLKNAGVDQIIRWKDRWGVAAMALTHRLRRLNLITEWSYRDACIRLAELGYRKAEPESSVPYESSQVLEKVMNHMRRNGQPMSEFAERVDLSVADLSEFLFGLAPIPLQGGCESAPRERNLRSV